MIIYFTGGLSANARTMCNNLSNTVEAVYRFLVSTWIERLTDTGIRRDPLPSFTHIPVTLYEWGAQ